MIALMSDDAANCQMSLTPARVHSLASARVRQLLQRFCQLCNAHEMTLWICQDGAMVPAISTSSQPEFELKFRQPLGEGIVSKVYAERAAYLERGLWRAAERSSRADQAIGQITQHEMCVPLQIDEDVCGVASAVQVTDGRHPAPARWGFTADDLAALETAAAALGIILGQAARLEP